MASSLGFITALSFSFVAALAWSSGSAVAIVPAIFVFGDSLADDGNNNHLNTTAKANFSPYGIDFPGGTPTGRFSNGYNNVDFLAKLVGFQQGPPPFPSVQNETQMLRGVNFASGGSGILDTTGQSIITFPAQIANFDSVVNAVLKQIGVGRTVLLSKSLFLISAGSNDMFAYYLTVGVKNITQNKLFIESLVDKFSDHLKTLYDHGARKFGIFGISHLGCIPLMRNLNPKGRCVNDLNGLARSFNTHAKARMHHLKSKLPGMEYSYGNAYDLMSRALAKPRLFGFKEIKSACCGSGKFNAGGPCIPTSTYCSDRSQYLFWDQFHPTQTTSMFLANKMYSGSRKFATPINVKTLAEF